MLVRDHPPPAFLPQPDSEAKPVARVLPELVRGAAAEQGMGEGYILTGCHLELYDLKHRALRLPLEERWPRVAIRGNPAHAIRGRRDIEHHDVVGVIGEHAVDVARVDRLRPTLDQSSNLGLVASHVSSFSINPILISALSAFLF
jgi:hypothetical protein